MDCNKVEAIRAKETAERRFIKRDFRGARKYAVKAQKLYPELEGITQMLATFDVYVASMDQVDGEVDFYSVLGVTSSANEEAVKRQYKKLALILHPDKNKTVGADGAFKLVSEAWALLSDNVRRASYDNKRNRRISVPAVFQPAYYPVPGHGVNGFNCSKPINPHIQPNTNTFWTVCTSCKVQYEYYRKYLNHKLTCKNCRKAFMAIETGTPANGSSSFCSWTVKPEYGHVTQVTLVPADNIFLSGAGAPGFPPGIATHYQNVTFQSSTIHGTSSIIGSHGLVSKSATVEHRGKEKRKGKEERMRTASNHTTAKNDSNCYMASNLTKPPAPKIERPRKKRKVNGDTSRNGNVGPGQKTATAEVKMANGNGKAGPTAKVCGSNEVPARRYSIAPAFDARQLLIQKARTAIRNKLAEVKLAAAASTGAAASASVAVAAKEEEKPKASSEISKVEELQTTSPKKELEISADLVVSADQSIKQSDHKEPESISIDVPDPDFHDFDIERTEGCFKPKQIWALYDEEDGMPRLYCQVRQVLSLKPFKILISYLHSKNNSEFGLGDSVDSGITKSCGLFRAGSIELVDQVNIFSHVMRGGKGLRGGGVQIFPKKGDIWAIYRNWSPDGKTGMSPELKHQYDMVEVLEDYTEALGVCVTPLVKVNGFRTVYKQKTDQNAIRWIPRREMLRLSHQVPSWLITGQANLPNGCCDLDPAATPEELLQVIPEVRTDNEPCGLDQAATPEELLQVIPEVTTDNKPSSISEQ